MKSVPFFKQSALLKPADWGLYDVLPLKNLGRLRLLPFVKGPLANTKIPHDVCGLAATLVLLYGHDDLALIESACFHYPKNVRHSGFKYFSPLPLYMLYTWLFKLYVVSVQGLIVVISKGPSYACHCMWAASRPMDCRFNCRL